MPTNDIEVFISLYFLLLIYIKLLINFQIIDKIIGEVPIRIYKPIDLDDQSCSPALIFYHGGGFIFDKLGYNFEIFFITNY